jgi:hypothetical protein
MKPLSALTQGDHACLLFSSRKDQVASITNYLKQGFPRKERCVFLGDPITVDKVKDSLQSSGINVQDQTDKEALVLTSERTFLNKGLFAADRMIYFLQQAEIEAKAAGFSGLRATGDIVWQMGPNVDFRLFLDYEKLLDTFLTKSNIAGLCQYHTDSVPAHYLEEAVKLHPHSIKAFSENSI